jgi:hypothetical protein
MQAPAKKQMQRAIIMVVSFIKKHASHLQSVYPSLKRSHALSIISKWLGYPSWQVARVAVGDDFAVRIDTARSDKFAALLRQYDCSPVTDEVFASACLGFRYYSPERLRGLAITIIDELNLPSAYDEDDGRLAQQDLVAMMLFTSGESISPVSHVAGYLLDLLRNSNGSLVAAFNEDYARKLALIDQAEAKVLDKALTKYVRYFELMEINMMLNVMIPTFNKLKHTSLHDKDDAPNQSRK